MGGSEVGIHGARGWVAAPPKGSGPGVVVCGDGGTALREFADRIAQDGYVVLLLETAGASVETAVNFLRDQPNCKGRMAALGFGAGALQSVQAAVQGFVDCAVACCGDDAATVAEAALSSKVPLVLHFPGIDRQADAFAGRNDIETYPYPEAGPGFATPGEADYDKYRADIAYTRTLGLLRKVMGPYYDLSALWEAHRACEFVTRDADATMKTMVDEPYVNHVPTLTGGYGQADLRRFYKHHFIPKNPKDARSIPISRTVGVDRVVNEGVLCFTHDTEIDWMLPGVKPTGKYIEVALVGIITFRGGKLCHEHIYWDQASVLVQVGLLDPEGLPVAGIESAKKVLDPGRPANALMANWPESAGKD
jgi:carboxymethylenebutenolidase